MRPYVDWLLCNERNELREALLAHQFASERRGEERMLAICMGAPIRYDAAEEGRRLGARFRAMEALYDLFESVKSRGARAK